ncbi:MAG: class I SAM-dependent methyltransferase [Clostridiales bacterium]|nr:class I SAM-dependent methyltransferase [Clostridiales bacterium]
MADKPLEANNWGDLYNENQLNALKESISAGMHSSWTKEMLSIAKLKPGSKILEIGAGSGQTSLALAKAGHSVTALDYSENPIKLAQKAAKLLNIELRTVVFDARLPLPFKEKEFDIIFHAGLLEHFEIPERIEMLKAWKPYCNLMVSMVPNAASLCYRIGKERREKNGTWIFGKEEPSYTQIGEFLHAGYSVKQEYTIGEWDALEFLEYGDSLRENMAAIWNTRNNEGRTDNFWQGYLLVTLGE